VTEPGPDGRGPAAAVAGPAALPSGYGALLRGAFDAHVHGQPDILAALQLRGSDLDTVRLAHAYGISGWVLKSHLWITTDRARLLQEQAAELHFVVLGSITLNPVMGGLSGTLVELAAAHGARVVFLPTWGSAADVARDGYIAGLLRSAIPSFDRYAAANAISLLTPDGRLSGPAIEVIDACRECGLALATGHAGLAESRAVGALEGVEPVPRGEDRLGARGERVRDRSSLRRGLRLRSGLSRPGLVLGVQRLILRGA